MIWKPLSTVFSWFPTLCWILSFATRVWIHLLFLITQTDWNLLVYHEGKEMIELYFDFRLYRLWKTRQHSKLLDYEDFLWRRSHENAAANPQSYKDLADLTSLKNCQGEPKLSSLLPSRRDEDASTAPTLQRDEQQIWTGISDRQEAETTGLSTLCQTFGCSQTQTCRKECGVVWFCVTPSCEHINNPCQCV